MKELLRPWFWIKYAAAKVDMSQRFPCEAWFSMIGFTCGLVGMLPIENLSPPFALLGQDIPPRFFAAWLTLCCGLSFYAAFVPDVCFPLRRGVLSRVFSWKGSLHWMHKDLRRFPLLDRLKHKVAVARVITFRIPRTLFCLRTITTVLSFANWLYQFITTLLADFTNGTGWHGTGLCMYAGFTLVWWWVWRALPDESDEGSCISGQRTGNHNQPGANSDRNHDRRSITSAVGYCRQAGNRCVHFARTFNSS